MSKFQVGDRVRVKNLKVNRNGTTVRSLKLGEVYTVQRIDNFGPDDEDMLYLGTSPGDGWLDHRFELVDYPKPRAGDTIRVTKVIEGKINFVSHDIAMLDNGSQIYLNSKDKVEIIERPYPTLPTQPGARVVSEGTYWVLATDGKWYSGVVVSPASVMETKEWTATV